MVNGEKIEIMPQFSPKRGQFIFSYMINRFKGELAELLGVQPCLELMEKLEKGTRLPGDVYVYWGDAIREYSRIAGKSDKNKPMWCGPVKDLPEAWKGMSPAEAGYNKIKQMLKTGDGAWECWKVV